MLTVVLSMNYRFIDEIETDKFTISNGEIITLDFMISNLGFS